jgi:hypothetical protein
MKKVLLLILTFTWLGGYAQLLNENFSYSTGQLTANGGGSNVSGGNWVLIGGTVQLTVNSGNLTYTGYPSSGVGNKLVTYDTSASAEDSYRTFAAQSSGTVYTSFLLNVDDTTRMLDNSTAGDYMVAFLPSSSTTTYGARLTFRKAAAGNAFNMGVRTTSTGSTVVVWAGGTYNPGTTYLVVLGYKFNAGAANDSAFLWVNPSISGATAPTPDAICPQLGASTDLADVARIAIRQSGGTPGSSLDGIRVGTSWSDISGIGGGPSPVTATSVSPLSFTTARVRWTKPGTYNASNQTVLVYMKDTSAINAGTASGSLTSISADSNFAGTGSTWINDAEAKCVYKGDGDSVLISGLMPGVTYHTLVMVIDTANSGNVYSSAAAANATQNRTQIFFTNKFGSSIEGTVTNTISVSVTNPGALNTDTTFVNLELSGGDATNGVDLATTFNTTVLKFPGNSSAAQTVSFGITNDNADEWNETLQFTIRNVSGGAAATITADSIFNFTIIDNDGIANPASGDLAFTNAQSAGTDVFELITLKRLDLRNLGLTDKGILADQTFNSAENIFNLPTAPYLNDVPAGTLVRVVNVAGTNDTLDNDGILRFHTTSFGLSTSGDQIIAFTGFNRFVAGINFGNTGWLTTGTVNTNTSYAPGTLADFHAGDRDNMKFRGPVTGIGSVILDSLLKQSNWDTSDTRYSQDFYPNNILFNQPTNQPTALTYTGRTLSTISLRWNSATSAPQRYVVVADTLSGTSAPVDSFTYRNNSNFSTSDTVITSASALTKGIGRVVYSGHDTVVTVSGLNNNTRYFFKVYAFNGNGSDANYNTTSPLSGDTTTVNPTVPVVKFAPISKTVTEDSTTVTIAVTLSNPNSNATSVGVAVKGGTATQGSDYTHNTQTVIFPANSSASQDVTVTIINDALVETAETIQFALRNATNSATIDADSVYTLTINDNDFTKIGFEVNKQTIAETIDTARIRVVMKDFGPNAPYTVNVSATPLTATATQDYSLLTTSLTFNGTADSVKTVLVKVFNTLPLESNESFVLQLSNPSTGAALDVNATDTITINNFTYPYYPIGQINKTDANGVLDSANRKYEVRGIVYGVNIRTAGFQFTINDGTGGLGTFSPSATFGYTAKEGDSIILYGRVAQFNGLAQIDNIDTLIVAGTNKATKAPVTVSALSEATESEYVMFSSLTLAPSANWPVTPFTGTGRNMFAYVNGNPADSIQIRIVVTSPLNGSPRPTEKFAMIGIGGQFDNNNPFTSGYQLFPMFLNHVINGDTVGFTTASATVNEAAGTVNISVSLKNPTALPTTVQVAVNGGSAAGSSDYTYTTQTVTFPANSNAAQTVTLSITDDNVFESNETIALTLINATNNATIDPAANGYIITITDNDPNGVKELNAVQFNVYPNPAREVLNIAADKEMNSVVVTDIIGNEVLSANEVNAKKATLNTASLKAGVYFVRVYSAEGSSVKKVIIR